MTLNKNNADCRLPKIRSMKNRLFIKRGKQNTSARYSLALVDLVRLRSPERRWIKVNTRRSGVPQRKRF
ncbi:MAG: hypothetical protein ACOY16_10820 [Chloroflexota bacterium]